jgi:hypothetical protein
VTPSSYYSNGILFSKRRILMESIKRVPSGKVIVPSTWNRVPPKWNKSSLQMEHLFRPGGTATSLKPPHRLAIQHP